MVYPMKTDRIFELKAELHVPECIQQECCWLGSMPAYGCVVGCRTEQAASARSQPYEGHRLLICIGVAAASGVRLAPGALHVP